ncbi:GNAT family N-acetyltransferase [Candidatus Laterigemmans baculatus]|uniref:GNAT family N-acetyltransferase n=1 Tax=Candidatus Laterigemmans baculatus TaxID=2770505 RepID=UPI0013DBEF87|nr:GNAT family N-acetyltransferase [Candidatus Laterigemmans baculatus]
MTNKASTNAVARVSECIESVRLDEVSFTFVEVIDAAFVLSLRTNPDLNRHLSAVSNDLAAQESWIREYKRRESQSTEFYFIIRKSDEPTGTVRIYDFREDSFCWGSWIIKPGASPRVSIASVQLVYKIGFQALGFAQSHFEVRKQNSSVNRFHLKMGAVRVGEDVDSYFYSIEKACVEEFFRRRDR